MTINEIIATSSVHAFNAGVESGRALERDRITKVIEHTVKVIKEMDAQEQEKTV